MQGKIVQLFILIFLTNLFCLPTFSQDIIVEPENRGGWGAA